MKGHTLFRSFCPLMMLFTSLVSSSGGFAQDELQQIRRAIGERGAQWTAGETWLTRLSLEGLRRLCGSTRKLPDVPRDQELSYPLTTDLPSRFDWRNNGGNWVTPPKDQISCGSCWDFAAVGQTESWWKIHHGYPDSMIDLSEQFVLSCAGVGSCDGGDVGGTLEFIRTTGVPSEVCFRYMSLDHIPCNTACDTWREEAVRIPGWACVSLVEPNISNIKWAVWRHPVAAFVEVFEDFASYRGGVYEHVWGAMAGGHFVLIVGWDDDQQCWICKNSWGADWGETVNFTPSTPGAGNGGYFRIKYDQAGIGAYTYTIWDETTGGPAFALSQREFDIKLKAGDSTWLPMMISNSGLQNLEFASMDLQTYPGARFHPDTLFAYSGASWWCGDPLIRGYGNWWLQYLDLPLLDLSETKTPRLSFVSYWALEEPLNVPRPWDGWDGCNVWVSVDGGSTFEIAAPVNPPYTCSSLHGFGGGIWGWGMGPGVAGWGGRSNGWMAVDVDLSPYIADSVVIRFAFASDAGLCTSDDPSLVGFAVDDILVGDRELVLFENHGEPDSTMHVHGNTGRGKSDWLTMRPTTGSIEPKTSLPCGIHIDAEGLAPGRYCGVVFVTSNDSSFAHLDFFSARITINLAVDPETSIRQEQTSPLRGEYVLAQNYPNPFNPTTRICYGLPRRTMVSLAVFNLLGQQVALLVHGEQEAGHHAVTFDGSDLSSGLYFYRMQAGGFADTKTLALIR